jgi:hypothetical protein
VMRSGDSLSSARTREDSTSALRLRNRGDMRVVVVAVAVEQHAGIADLGTQHPHQVPGRGLRQCDPVANRQRGIDMQRLRRMWWLRRWTPASPPQATRVAPHRCNRAASSTGCRRSGRSTTPRCRAAR